MYVFKRFAVVGSSMLGEFSCTMVCIPYIASTVHGQVRLLLRIHIHVLISCSLRTTACGLLHISLRLSSVSPGICNTYHYVARCILRSHLLLRSLSPLFPLLSPLGVCIFFLQCGHWYVFKVFPSSVRALPSQFSCVLLLQ